jgi:hypothetical protein
VSLVADKHNNYVMAALPVFSLWAGRSFVSLAAWIGRPQRIATHREALLWDAGLLAAAILAATLTIRYVPEFHPTGWIFSGIILCGAWGTVWYLRAGRRFPAAVALMSSFLVCYLFVMACELPKWDHRRAAALFAEKVRADVQQGEDVIVYRMGMNPMVFYLADPVSRLETPESLESHLSRHKKLTVVTYDTAWTEVRGVGEARLLTRSRAAANLPAPKDSQILLLELSARDDSPRIASTDQLPSRH